MIKNSKIIVIALALKWWFFVGAGTLALFVAWVSVGFQTLRAAKVNPVECLKDE
jgi:ABC-type lipoprotein release transport system permease subunit